MEGVDDAEAVAVVVTSEQCGSGELAVDSEVQRLDGFDPVTERERDEERKREKDRILERVEQNENCEEERVRLSLFRDRRRRLGRVRSAGGCLKRRIYSSNRCDETASEILSEDRLCDTACLRGASLTAVDRLDARYCREASGVAPRDTGRVSCDETDREDRASVCCEKVDMDVDVNVDMDSFLCCWYERWCPLVEEEMGKWSGGVDSMVSLWRRMSSALGSLPCAESVLFRQRGPICAWERILLCLLDGTRPQCVTRRKSEGHRCVGSDSKDKTNSSNTNSQTHNDDDDDGDGDEDEDVQDPSVGNDDDSVRVSRWRADDAREFRVGVFELCLDRVGTDLAMRHMERFLLLPRSDGGERCVGADAPDVCGYEDWISYLSCLYRYVCIRNALIEFQHSRLQRALSEAWSRPPSEVPCLLRWSLSSSVRSSCELEDVTRRESAKSCRDGGDDESEDMFVWLPHVGRHWGVGNVAMFCVQDDEVDRTFALRGVGRAGDMVANRIPPANGEPPASRSSASGDGERERSEWSLFRWIPRVCDVSGVPLVDVDGLVARDAPNRMPTSVGSSGILLSASTPTSSGSSHRSRVFSDSRSGTIVCSSGQNSLEGMTTSGKSGPVRSGIGGGEVSFCGSGQVFLSEHFSRWSPYFSKLHFV